MQPLEQGLVLLPGRDLRKQRAVHRFLKCFPIHLKIRASIDLSCLDVDVTKEVADDLERDATLQQVHTLCVSQAVRTHPLREVRVTSAYRNHILLQEITHT